MAWCMERRTGIGGFFGLELPEYGNFPQWHPGRSVAVNSGRRALEYILRRLGDVRCVRVPLYTCRTVVETMERLGIPVITYRIDERLEPEELPNWKRGNTFCTPITSESRRNAWTVWLPDMAAA